MEIYMGSSGQIMIAYTNLSVTEAAKLMDGILKLSYELSRQSKVTLDVISSALPYDK